MAKISAHGATKVAEIRTTAATTKGEAVWVLCSDRRVLRRFVGLSGLELVGKCKVLPTRADEAERLLTRIALSRGYDRLEAK